MATSQAKIKETSDVIDADLPYGHGYLTIVDVPVFKAAFQKGKSKNDVLKDVHWKAGAVLAGKCDGKSIFLITYTLLSDPKDIYKSEAFIAIFVDGKFDKFIPWITVEKPGKPPYCNWIIQATQTPEINLDEVLRKSQSAIAPTKQIDGGLTIAMLMLRSKLKAYEATQNDFVTNATLRKQFNAARLDIGMTVDQVEKELKTKSIDEGELKAGYCKIYGSKIAFAIDPEVHFMNIGVIYRNEEVVGIVNIQASGRSLGEAFKGIDYLKERDN